MNNRKEKLAQMEADYQIRKREDEILTLNAEDKVKNIQLYSMIGFCIMILVLIVLVYGKYKNSRSIRNKLMELDELRSRFFSNISHEFRTPLTLIIAPIKQHLDQSFNEDDKKEFSSIYRNATRLKSLIEQLLDLAKIDADKMLLRVNHCDINRVIEAVCSYFEVLAEARSVEFAKSIEKDLKGYVDVDKLEKILYNLLSNAFKSTPDGCCIRIAAALSNNWLYITVRDAGIGMTPETLDKLFERFYEGNNPLSRPLDGTGIGLALVSELVQNHKGKITVESSPDEGNEFLVELPISDKSYSKDEIDYTSDSNVDMPIFFPYAESLDAESVHDESSFLAASPAPWLLVVEDNPDLLNYLLDSLKFEYRIITARDGKQAWEKALGMLPDAILCDYMMPKMDGRTFCLKIKTHPLTCHIPVMMVTARAAAEDRLEVLRSGADQYLIKPFDINELKLKLHNLLETKDKQSLTSLEEGSHYLAQEIPKPDADFMEKIMSIISSNYPDAGFGVDQLTQKLQLSKTQFHRKLKSITNRTPAELIRSYRLDKAKKMLATKGVQVSDVATKVGYRNLSNFTKIFKEYSGRTPSEYASNSNAESLT